MKRRTRKAERNAVEHKAAFDHAYQVFKPLVKKRRRNEKAHHNRQGDPIRFSVDLELEAGGTIEVVFSRVTGFRLESFLGHHWEAAEIKPETHRGGARRLDAYRRKLIHWQQIKDGGFLTFRHFNLLLAAFSYDPANP
jgi:hypothetical protein